MAHIKKGVGGVVFVLLVFALFASPAWGQGNEGCPNPRQIAEFSGENDQITKDFNITGNTFRLRYTLVEIDRDPILTDSFTISPREGGQGIGEGEIVFEPGTYSDNILAGPGTFDLEIDTDGFEYTVFVDDCRGTTAGETSTGGNSTGNKTKREKKRKNRQENRQERRISQEEQLIDAENDLLNDDEITDDEITDGENTDDNIFDDDLEDDDLDDDNNGVSATADENGAEASTPGAVASAGGDPDEQAPQNSVPNDVVDEIPTSGPLPNTGGMSPVYWLLPLGGLLILAGLPVYRWIKSRG